MKFGIMSNKNNINIGDDIQALATSYFLPSVDYFIDREKINEFVSDDEEPVAVLMNAWYMWAKWHWPPSKYIVPKFIGFHYADHQLAIQPGSPIKYEFLTGLGGEYLKNYGPIGARDEFTKEQLKDLGIDSYFSGCITLTLPKMPKIETNRYICLVDLEQRVVDKIKKDLSNEDIEIKVITHNKPRNIEETWEDRKQSATELLTVYQNAVCVVTKRLHCALPCLAMEVPVFLIKGRNDDIRFTPYYEYLHRTTPTKFVNNEYEYDFLNPPKNPSKYLETRNNLIEICTSFVENIKNETRSVEELNQATFCDDDIIKWRHDQMIESMDVWLMKTRKDFFEIEKYKRDVKRLNEELKLVKAIKTPLHKRVKRKVKRMLGGK
ncbi:MAG: polysaccharide pyruvyl transferase family protein [Anaerovoracaceae bacterium]